MRETTFAACPYCPVRLEKPAWIRLNRLLAWALLVSPAVQLLLRTDFWRGLWLDFAIFCAHGALSLALFGPPPGLGALRLWTGTAAKNMSVRAKFLLGGWRIALALLSTPLFLLPGAAGWLAVLPIVYVWVRLPWHVVVHVFGGVGYALRRWGMRVQEERELVAACAVVLFLVASAFNLFR